MKLFKRKFNKTLYCRIMETYLSCCIPIAFGSTAVLIDRCFNLRYKVINAAVAWIFVFMAGILPLLHPILLRAVKK
jgi:hypothetical protein